MDPYTKRVLQQAVRQQAAVQQSRTQTALKAISEFKEHCIALAAKAHKEGKPASLLSDFERLGVVFAADIPVEYDGHTFRYQAVFSDLDENGVVDGKYHVQADPSDIPTHTEEPPCQA